MTRMFIAAVLVCGLTAALPAVSTDNFAKIAFTDGKERGQADFAGHTAAVFAFCRS